LAENIVVSQYSTLKIPQNNPKSNISNLVATLNSLKSQFGENHLTCAELHNNIAFVLSKTGKLNEALMNYQQSLQIVKMNYGEDHPAIGSCLSYIANTMLSLGNVEGAISNFGKAIRIFKKTDRLNE
jgi:tetratricopeptide (TPR) repeat protein